MSYYYVIRRYKITRQFVRAHRDWIFLFGDNLAEVGYGGQAAEMRGEPNSIGIPTKVYPGRNPNDYMTDRDYTENVRKISNAFSKIPPPPRTICLSTSGLGTGLSQLGNRAPLTYHFLQAMLKSFGI